MRDADEAIAHRDPLDGRVGRAERFSATRRNAGGAGPSPDLRIVPAARSAAPGTRRGAGSVREFHQLFARRPRRRASIACAERAGVPGEYVFRQRGRAVPQFRARDADSRTCCGACSWTHMGTRSA